MCPSYKLVVRLIRPILDRPKSVSLMWPIEVIRRLSRNSRRTVKLRFVGLEQFTFSYSFRTTNSVLLVRLQVAVDDAVVV